MPGTQKNTPAQWIGGQRRRLVRRNRSNAGPPRSNTMPVLKLDSAAASLISSSSNVGSGYERDRESEDSFDQHGIESRAEYQGFEGKMQSHVSSGAVKVGEHDALADGPPTATDSKKKPGLFHSKKPKALERPNVSTQVLISPLPASTPTKAARFFGLDAKCNTPDSPRSAKVQHDDAPHDFEVAPVRPALERQHSIPLLTRFKLGTGNKQPQVKDLHASEDSKLAKASKDANTDGLRMLIPEFPGSRRSPREQTTATAARFEVDGSKVSDGYKSAGGPQEARSRTPTAPQPVPIVAARRKRRKQPKNFQRMSPIAEASIESLRPAYRNDEEVTELGVISEYEYDEYSYSTEHLQNSQSHISLELNNTRSFSNQHGQFALDEADLSPSDEFYNGGATDEEDDVHVVHPGTKVDLKRAPGHIYHLRSPLQNLEDVSLDATEEQMQVKASQRILAKVEAEKRAMDAEIAILKREHEQFKLEFNTITTSANESTTTESDKGDDDLVSLSGSIELDEESIVHQAQAITVTRIAPGMVKLVEIPPRKKTPGRNILHSTSDPRKTALAQHMKKDASTMLSAENAAPPLMTHNHHEDPDCNKIPKKSKLTRDESRLLVQNWILDYNNTEQRPISTRVDPDVLADQETPPAPFPKSDESLPTPPIKPCSEALPRSLTKHQCINNGHIFHPVDLKTIPDDALVNSLEVRPYLQTYTGIKQHVKIPVLCEKCGEDCDENVWECEIAVCRMAVCQNCAEDMEAEWQERAVNGWKYK